MPTTSAYEQAANQLKTIIDTCYTADGFTAEHDELHEAVGMNGTRIGIAPDERGDIVSPGNGLVQETYIMVRFQGKYNLQVNPDQSVDPRLVANYAERLRRAIQDANYPQAGTDQKWYYLIVDTRYPRDATGNKTRFFMLLKAFGNNTGVVETTG
jgi:hypothetical protein